MRASYQTALLVGAATVLGTASPMVAQQKAAVAGVVTDTAGRPLSGVLVQAIHSLEEAGGEARTGADGRYVISNLAAGGPYVVAVRRLGYRARATYDLTLHAGETATVDFKMSRAATELARVRVSGHKGSSLASPVITAEEIEQYSVRSALDIIDRYRPTWLRGGLRECPAPSKVYINGIRRDRPGEGIEYLLYDIPAYDIQEMRLADCHSNVPIDRQNAIYIVSKPGLSGL